MPERERYGLAGMSSPGKDGAACCRAQEPSDLGAGHVGHRGGEVDEVVGGA